MPSPTKHVDDSQLHVLLFGDDTSDAYRSASAHVETCEACRARLDDLSGDEDFDAETRGLLRGFLDADASTNSPDCTHTAADVDRLGPPRHPEMLGRIGRYDVERVIGSGGMGVVFKGFDTELNRPVALKLLAKHLAHSGAARQRFAREARAAAAVVHEHVLAIHNVEVDSATDAGAPFLVMPYVAGESLQARVDRDGPLEAKEILRIGAQAAAGLQAAHDQGVVHRDIKPGNILLEGGVERALVTDFGLAQTVDDATLTRTGVITGTPNYMAPEQATGQPTDARSDLFSLGCVLYFMATGRPPFRAERAMGVLHRVCNEPHTPVWRTRPETPDGLCELIDRLLNKKPTRRPSSAGEVQRLLQEALANLQRPAPRTWIALKRFTRRRRKALRLGLAACLSGLAGAAVLMAPEQPSREPSQQPETAQHAKSQEAFPLAAWRMASPQEAEQWSANVRQLNERLEGLKSSAPPLGADPWDESVRSLYRRLEQYRSDASF